jgi:hypothetical protein
MQIGDSSECAQNVLYWWRFSAFSALFFRKRSIGAAPQQNLFVAVSCDSGLICILVRSSVLFAGGTSTTYLFIFFPHSANLVIRSTAFAICTLNKFKSLALRAELGLPIPLGKPIPPSRECCDCGCHDRPLSINDESYHIAICDSMLENTFFGFVKSYLPISLPIYSPRPAYRMSHRKGEFLVTLFAVRKAAVILFPSRLIDELIEVLRADMMMLPDYHPAKAG